MSDYDVSDIEDLVKEEEPEPEHDNSSLLFSKIGYNAAVFIVDLGTGYLIWQLTFWYYGLIWFLAGAVVFFMHQKNYFTAGNNDKQMKGALNGIIVAVVTMILMAITAGSLYIFGIRDLWIEAGLISVSLSLFFWHAYQLAMYVFNDDGFRIENTITRSFAQADKKKKIAKASGIVVRAHREAENEKRNQYGKHGQRNIDAAISRMNGRPMSANAYETEKPELDNTPKKDFGGDNNHRPNQE